MKLFYLLSHVSDFLIRCNYRGKYLFRYDDKMVMQGATDSISAANRFLQSDYLLDGSVPCAITECDTDLPIGFCMKDDACFPSRLLYPSDYDACTIAISDGIYCSKCKHWVIVDENGDNRIR